MKPPICLSCTQELEPGPILAEDPTVAAEKSYYGLNFCQQFECKPCERIYVRYEHWKWDFPKKAKRIATTVNIITEDLIMISGEPDNSAVQPGDVLAEKKHLRLIKGGKEEGDPFNLKDSIDNEPDPNDPNV